MQKVEDLEKIIENYKETIEHLQSYKTLYEALHKQGLKEEEELANIPEDDDESHDQVDNNGDGEENSNRSMSKKELLTKLKCSVCTEYLIYPVNLTCEHIFCFHCLKEWVNDHRRCPVCRTRILNIDRIYPNKCFTQLVNQFFRQHLSDETLKGRRALIIERGNLPAPTASSSSRDFYRFDDDVSLGSFFSRFEHMLPDGPIHLHPTIEAIRFLPHQPISALFNAMGILPPSPNTSRPATQ